MKISALITGRKGSKGFPNKNIYELLGKPLTAYPIEYAINSNFISDVFVSTDCPVITEIAKKYGCQVIERPDFLCTDDASHYDVMQHGLKHITNFLGSEPDLVVIMLSNCAILKHGILDEGIQLIVEDERIDSCATVSEYSEFNISRALKIENGVLEPFLSMEELGITSSDRKALGETYFCDSGAYIVRPKCLKNGSTKYAYQWLGERCLPLVQQWGLDVDDERGMLITKSWLEKNIIK